ncbi:MAG: serine/threonine protein kinase, partial [Bdellovibrionota bacterium]
QVGRFVARLHAVGARVKIPNRNTLDVETMGVKPLAFLIGSSFFTDSSRARYQDVAGRAVARAQEILAGGGGFRTPAVQSIHGDCHVGNILWDANGPFFVDFDDCVVGPPVQDIWMIVRGRGEEANQARETLLSGYEQMREFDRTTLRLVEPLRALRMIHYAAWVAKRWEDPSFPRLFPMFGTERYWQEEIEALGETVQAMETPGYAKNVPDW